MRIQGLGGRVKRTDRVDTVEHDVPVVGRSGNRLYVAKAEERVADSIVAGIGHGVLDPLYFFTGTDPARPRATTRSAAQIRQRVVSPDTIFLAVSLGSVALGCESVL